MTTIFLTATGTEIGKTFVAAGLIHALKRKGREVAAIKPLVSGYEDWSAPASEDGFPLVRSTKTMTHHCSCV